MDANRLIHHTTLLIAAGFFVLSVSALAQDTKLTPDQYGRMCAFAGTCEETADKSDLGQSASAPSEVLDVSDTHEQRFSVFSSGGAPSRPLAHVSSPAPRNGPGPKLFPVGRKTSLANATSPLVASGVKRHRLMTSRRPNADDMRVQFANGSAELSASDFPELNFWAHGLHSPEFSHLKIRIEGHTNAVGNRDFNLALSERRAKAVADYLAAHGISQDRIEAKGYGFEKPRIEGDPDDPRNRRVEIIKVN